MNDPAQVTAPAAPAQVPGFTAPAFEQVFPVEHARLTSAESNVSAMDQQLREHESRLEHLEQLAAKAEEFITRAANSRGLAAAAKLLGIELEL